VNLSFKAVPDAIQSIHDVSGISGYSTRLIVQAGGWYSLYHMALQ